MLEMRLRRGLRVWLRLWRHLVAIAVAIGAIIPVTGRSALHLRIARVLLAHGLGQKPQIMLGVLLEILGRNPIIAQLRITRELIVLVDDLLRGAAHLALGPG